MLQAQCLSNLKMLLSISFVVSLRRLLSLWREPLIKYLAAIVIFTGLRLYLCNEVGSVY